MQEYFKNLIMVDPLFHSVVLSRIRSLMGKEGLPFLSIDQLTEEDELAILREYCIQVSLEVRTLRSTLLENMQVDARSVSIMKRERRD